MFFFKKKTQWQSDLTDHACSPLLRDYKIIVYIVILLTVLADLVSTYISNIDWV